MTTEATPETPTLKIGDVVCLKSGGPAMTVLVRDHEYSEEYWKCAWFDGGIAGSDEPELRSVLGQGTFPASALRPLGNTNSWVPE